MYEFPLHDKAKPEKVLFISGQVKAEMGELFSSAILEIKSMATKKVKRIDVNPENGKYVGVVNVENNEDFLVTVKIKDYAFNSHYISSNDRFFDKPADLNFIMKSIEEGESFRINNIYFDTDEYNLNVQAKNVLNSFTEFMLINPNICVEIHGHTDNVGNKKSNLELSDKRAQMVHDYLLKAGISDLRLSYKGFGEDKPLVQNNNEDNRAINRRTEFFILKK